MSKTWWSVTTALCLVLVSAGIFIARRTALGAAPFGATTWQVTLVAAGELNAPDAAITIHRPPDFRHQHIFREGPFQSTGLIDPILRGRDPKRTQLVWRRAGGQGSQPFRLSYTFRCLMGMRHPSHAMALRTHELDGKPPEGTFEESTPGIEKDAPEVEARAIELVEDHISTIEQVKALYDYVKGLDNEPTGRDSALACLRAGGGDSAGKSRLLVALCRNRGIPARLIVGLVLEHDREQGLHYWAEAWIDDDKHWQPMCPTYGHFGGKFPHHYLVLQVGDEPVVRPRGAVSPFTFRVVDLRDPFGQNEDRPPTRAQLFWQRMSLYSLRLPEQHLVRFLLLLPLAALIVSIFRTVIGITTFGTFGPALLGLAFLDLKALHWGLGIFVLTVLVGWGMRRYLDRYHLLMVSRISILLTLIVLFLVAVIIVAGRLGIAATQYISLFPLVILTHLVERFWTVETEDGTIASFKTLLGTIVVAVAISLLLSPDYVTVWMFRHPETLGVVLAAQFLLGRYTGYRLTELYRFRDLIVEEHPHKGSDPVTLEGQTPCADKQEKA